MVLGSVIVAIMNPFVIAVACVTGLLFQSSRGVWVGAALGAIAFRVTFFWPVFLPFAGFPDIGLILTGALGAFFWAALANRLVRPWVLRKLERRSTI